MLIRAVLALGIGALLVCPSHADWQNTRWGMPLADVLVLPGVSSPSESEMKGKSDYGRTAAKSSYPVQGIPFDAYYLVTGDRLTGVKLIAGMPFSDASKVLSLLDSTYGRPVRESDDNVATCRIRFKLFRDDAKKNLVTTDTLACGPGNTVVTITYSPLNGSNQPGGL